MKFAVGFYLLTLILPSIQIQLKSSICPTKCKAQYWCGRGMGTKRNKTGFERCPAFFLALCPYVYLPSHLPFFSLSFPSLSFFSLPFPTACPPISTVFGSYYVSGHPAKAFTQR